MTKLVIHRDWTSELFQTEKIIDAIKYLLDGVKIDDPFIVMFKIIKNFELKLPEQISTQEIDQLLLKSIEPLISEDVMYDDLCTRQLIKMVNKSVNQVVSSFSWYINYAVDNWLLDPQLKEFDLWTLELSLNDQRDDLMNYFGLVNLRDRYLIKTLDKTIIEKTQWMWMRIAMWLSINETDKNGFALKVYEKLSTLKYLHSTPTLFYSGTNTPQLISCFIGVIGDSLEDIMQKTNDAAFYAKYAWGTAFSVTKLRASGSPVKKINSTSCGPIPFIKIYDTVISSVAIGGKRSSNLVIYMEPWHYDFEQFLELKETNWNELVRARRLNMACWIPDLFMQRVMEDGEWYMFDPAETEELAESRGNQFNLHYQHYCEMAENGQIKRWRKTSARELYRQILIMAAKTGNYWINFKDRHNECSSAPSYGLIHSSNMCTEISIPNREDSTATCTLASINLSRFVDKARAVEFINAEFETKITAINREDIKDTARIAIQALDNVIELNHFVSESSRKNSYDLRPLGLGVMWFGELLIHLWIAYDSPEAVSLSSLLSKTIYDTALEQSELMAETRGTFADYNPDTYSYKPRRNALLLAIAPTATISNIAGTSSGIEPFFSNIYSREILLGKFTVVVKPLVEQLKTAGLWTEEMRNKLMSSGGSVQALTELKDYIDLSIYRTVYESSPMAQIDIAAAWQEHIDQAISRNLYLAPQYRDQTFDIYLYAWQKKLKTTYYCFVEKDIQGEKYTEQVNKRGERTGFGGGTQVEGSASRVPTRWFGAALVPATQENNKEDVIIQEDVVDPVEEIETHTANKIAFGGLTKAEIEAKLVAENGQEYVDKLKKWELYDGACPVNPFEKVMCEGCQ